MKNEFFHAMVIAPKEFSSSGMAAFDLCLLLSSRRTTLVLKRLTRTTP